MRRKFPGKSQAGKEPLPGAPAVPPRPDDLKRAQGELQERLLGREAHVATGYGFGDGADRTPAWRLYVFTDDVGLELPREVMGFPVNRRGVPQALLAKK